MLGHSHEWPPPRPPATLRGPIQRLPAWIKFFAAVALVLSASLCPPTHAIWLLVPTAAVLLIALLSRISPRVLIRRILLLEPFVLGVALLAFFSPGTTEQRWMFFGFLVARCTLALATMVLFAATTPFAEMLRLFRTLRVPMLLVTTLALMHRYLFVLSDEASRMRRARQSSSTMSVGVTEPKSRPRVPAFTSKRSTVFVSVSAISCACSTTRASWRARCSSRLRSSPRSAGVAGWASPRGSR